MKRGAVVPAGREPFTITPSAPQGAVAAVLGMARAIGLDRVLGARGNRCRDLGIADLATLAPERPLTLTTRPTTIQQKAFDRLALACTQ